MTVTDQIKISDKKVKLNEAQYDLNKKAVIISASSSFSNDLVDKYEYLTGKDLGLKPSTIEQAKFEYSRLGKVFTKGLNKDDQKDGLFKRLENIKNSNSTHLQVIKDKGEQQLRELKNISKNKTLETISEIGRKNNEANKILLDIKKINN